MKEATVAIFYRPGGVGDPIPLALTQDGKALRAARDAVLRELEARVGYLEDTNPDLAVLERGELEKLRNILKVFIPGPLSMPLRER
ncbi:hypothetical protein ACFLU6_06625 [Acidobacteriota bacterium]